MHRSRATRSKHIIRLIERLIIALLAHCCYHSSVHNSQNKFPHGNPHDITTKYNNTSKMLEARERDK